LISRHGVASQRTGIVRASLIGNVNDATSALREAEFERAVVYKYSVTTDREHAFICLDITERN
jgi:hypothetical protein